MYGPFKTELRSSSRFHLTMRTPRFLDWFSIYRLLGCITRGVGKDPADSAIARPMLQASYIYA